MDIIEDIKGSKVQHGPHNGRIYLMRLNTERIPGLIAALDHLAIKNSYGKIFGKIPAPAWHHFERAGYNTEAMVPKFFQGKTDGYFIAKYYSVERQTGGDNDPATENKFTFVEKPGNSKQGKIPATSDIVPCHPADANELSAVYQRVFQSYPFPIHDPEYLKQAMEEGALYYGIRVKRTIASAAAMEIDFNGQNVEMTDFATLPKWRGLGLAGSLLAHMEQRAGELGLETAYTIARAAAPGINSIFQKNGYQYAGLLKNNTQISGSIQNMTVWYKHL